MRWTIVKSNYLKTLQLTRYFKESKNINLSSSYFYKRNRNISKFAINSDFLKENNRYLHLSCILEKGGKKKLDKPQKVDLNEAKQFINTDKYISQMDSAIEELKTNYVKHLTLRSSTGSMDQIMVTFEGEEYMLQELVQIAYKPKVVVLDAGVFPQAIPQILEAINKSGMNVNPQQDGTTLFVPIPKVTKEHRENLAKNAKTIFIKSRDKIKDIRSQELRGLKKKPSISEDQVKRIQAQLDLVCDNYVMKAESILDIKQKELLKTSD